MLSEKEERALARLWCDHEDLDAAHQLVTAHLRLVAKIAMGYRGYGLPLDELISEGNIGMMRAVLGFDPDRGFRFSTYALWWIRAAIQEYVLHSWSLVKIGTTAAQKKLFFNLRRLKGQMQAIDDGDLQPHQVGEIARLLDVTEEEVVSMNRRLAGSDRSLNVPASRDSRDEWQDWLVDETEGHEAAIAEREELTVRRAILTEALKTLNERERHILTERRLKDNPTTLEELSRQRGISRERVRQIEVRALAKLQHRMADDATAHRNRGIDTWHGGGTGIGSATDRAACVCCGFSNHGEGFVFLPQAAQYRPDLCDCVDEGADHRTAGTRHGSRHRPGLPSRFADIRGNPAPGRE
jgi:RNA polymerase sigma-32 factor